MNTPPPVCHAGCDECTDFARHVRTARTAVGRDAWQSAYLLHEDVEHGTTLPSPQEATA